MKAREIIPGWPRGRSTSRPLAAGSLWPWEYTYSLTTGELLHIGPRTEWLGLGREPQTIRMVVGGGDFCFKHRVSCLQRPCAECRAEWITAERKLDMMEMFYVLKRIGAEQASDWPECLFELIVSLSTSEVHP